MRERKYIKQTYLLMTLDPVHIGTGGYRLGRVDNAIIREPGTNLPKIPGTSLSGALRQYAAYHLGRPQCAGQGGQSSEEEQNSKKHCGFCPVCYTFGYVRGEESNSYAGTVNLFDARLLLFPVHSVQGPVWVTTKDILKDNHFSITGWQDETKKEQDETKKEIEEVMPDEIVVITGEWSKDFLNLGSLLLRVKRNPGNTANLRVKLGEPSSWKGENGGAGQLRKILDNTVIVTHKLFEHLVNSNLEIRTSVSIDPDTGAAKSHMLFTYEAIPRATVLTFEVVEDLYRKDSFHDCCDTYTQKTGKTPPKDWESSLDVAKTGLKMAEMLGVGGMGTRGFGRIRNIGSVTETPTTSTQEG